MARCRPGAGWSTGAGPHHFSAELVGAVCTGAGLLLALVPVEMVQHRTPECDTRHSTAPALLYLRTQQNIHIGLGGWAAAQQNWQRWRNEWLATLNIDMLGWAGLGWAGLTMEIYKYFVQFP